MSRLLIACCLIDMMSTLLIFDFVANSDISSWYVVNDGVMGGLSQGRFYLNDEGHGVFEGTISLENNGGFSSIRHSFTTMEVKDYTKVVIRLKGDGKRYQFRVRSERYQRYSYIAYFTTSGRWQTLEIPLSEMYPSFRGYRLEKPNYPGETLEEIAFLIGNKKAENFRLVLDKISLE